MKLSPKYYIAILSLFSVSFLEAQEIQINEFMAANTRIIPEMYDFGDYNDWIELFNPMDFEQSLDDYFLSDNSNNPLKWKIPNGALIPGDSYFLIWADGYDDGPGSVHQRPSWPWDDFTTRHFHTNFKLSANGEEILLSRATAGALITVIDVGSSWSYLDNGSDQGTAWTDLNYNDSFWGTGVAELGYGDGDEVTELSYGSDPDNKYITSYFRHSFQILDAADITTLTIQLKRDDGAILHLNGQELLRVNMPEGDVNFMTSAATVVSGSDEDTWFEYVVSAAELLTGDNVLAVEIHQVSATSSDISFDLELSAQAYSNTVIVDAVEFGAQLDDISMGRVVDTGEWRFFGEPTPGESNIGPGTLELVYGSEVNSSLSSGFYEGPHNITLATGGAGDIYYSLDGSTPTSLSFLYTTAVTIDENTILRARTIASEGLPGPILTVSYFIDTESDLPVASLVAQPATLWDTEIGIYENEYKQREIPVSLEYFSPEKELQFQVNAGTRLGGQNIWTKPQKPFTIYMRNRYGDESIHYQLFKNRPVVDFSRIVFRNGGDDWEETLIRDPLAESLITGMMDAGYMAYQPTTLFLNGEYWGIHNIREKFNTQFFAENYGANPDNIDHLEYASTPSGTQLLVIEGDLNAYNELLSFIQNNDLNQPELYGQLKNMMNVDGFIDHLMMTQYTANTSWSHNREWWRPGDGKWQWLIVDLDRGLNASNININIMDNMAGEYTLFNMLLDSDFFKQRFIQRGAAHLNNTFHADRVIHLVDSLSAMIAPEIPRHTALWGPQGGIPSASIWEIELQNIRDFASARNAVVFNQMNSELNLDGTVQVSALPYISEGGHILIEDVPVLQNATAQTFFRNRDITLTAIPNPGYEFIGWNHGPTEAEISYDCAADGDFIALFQPSGEIILPAVITENTTLLANQVYVVTSDLFIPDGVSLVVEDGVKILMPDDGNIMVEGWLLMGGSIENPVQVKPNTQAGASRWGGLSFLNSSGPNNLTNVEIRGASHGIDPLLFPAAISSQNSELTLSGLDLDDVEFPVFAEGGNLSLYNSSIRSEVVCDFVNVKRGGAIIVNNRFYGSDAPDTDAIDLDGVSISGAIAGNKIYNFSGPNSDGIDLGEGCEYLRISDNLIYHSSDKGISIGQSQLITIENNLIVGCVMGIALKDSASAYILNNTFANNVEAIACYEKNVGSGGGHGTTLNNLFYANSGADLSVDAYSSATTDYSLSNTQQLTGTGNLFQEPLFVNPANYNFSLQANSPCIDTGDPDLPPDEDGTRSDIGYGYEYNVADYPFEIQGPLLAQLKLNEFLADNSALNSDEAGEFDDWLEIFNPTNTALDLAGLYLTDNPSNLEKWQIPPAVGLIPPGGYVLVWCDEDGSQGPLHANFKLSASGEFIALVKADGMTILDSTSFGGQLEDVSMGRTPDGAAGWVYMTPTPASSNHGPLSTQELAIPDHFFLEQNYPNPFNPSTTIRFGLPDRGAASLTIYDIRGRLVSSWEMSELDAGWHSYQWLGRDLQGQTVAAGVYLVRIQAGSESQMIKMLLLK